MRTFAVVIAVIAGAMAVIGVLPLFAGGSDSTLGAVMIDSGIFWLLLSFGVILLHDIRLVLGDIALRDRDHAASRSVLSGS